MSGYQSKEHKKVVKDGANFFNAKIIKVQSGRGIHYFPDLKTDGADIECEICPKVGTLMNKIEKWDKTRKKILVVSFFDVVWDNFDEVYFYNGDFVKVK